MWSELCRPSGAPTTTCTANRDEARRDEAREAKARLLFLTTSIEPTLAHFPLKMNSGDAIGDWTVLAGRTNGGGTTRDSGLRTTENDRGRERENATSTAADKHHLHLTPHLIPSLVLLSLASTTFPRSVASSGAEESMRSPTKVGEARDARIGELEEAVGDEGADVRVTEERGERRGCGFARALDGESEGFETVVLAEVTGGR